MRGTNLVRSIVLAGLTTGMVAAVGCESHSDPSTSNGGYTSGGTTHGVGSSSTAAPDSPIGAGSASPNTNGVRNLQSVGERAETGSVSSGTGTPRNAPIVNPSAGVVVPDRAMPTTIPTTVPMPDASAPSPSTGAPARSDGTH